MKNRNGFRNGFTLVELIAVIVVLAILLTLGIGVYNRVFENQQQRAYENKVSMIELSAVKWASESNLSRPTTITVQKLIDDTYYQADRYDEDTDEYIVEDPRDNSSLLCNTIDIVINNGEPNATMNETKDCDLKNQESDSKYITIYAYQYDSDTKKVGNALTIDNTNTIAWTKTGVLLVVNPNGKYKDLTYSKVIFSSGANSHEKEVNNNLLGSVSANTTLANVDSYANAYIVDASLFLQAEYTVSLETSEGLKNKDVYVQIDKEAPTIEAIIEGGYTNADKDIRLRGSDGAGSGLKGFYISTSPTDPGNEFIKSDYETIVKKPNGQYFVFGEDNAGNVSEEGEELDVSNVDKSSPTCRIEIVNEGNLKPTLGSNGWYTSNVTIRMISESAATGTGISYALTTSKTPIYDQGFAREGEIVTKDILLNEDKIHTYYGYVKNSLGATGTCNIEVKVDRVKPKAKAKKSPLPLGDGDYDFKDNVDAEFGPAGGEVVCDPPSSRKTGSYTVTCQAVGNNGEVSDKFTFDVVHSYPATANWGTCVERTNCHWESGESCDCNWVWCESSGGNCVTCDGSSSLCCEQTNCIPWSHEVCDERSYSCIKSYSCPQGGSPKGGTCYY